MPRSANIIVDAKPGTGKTWTITECVNRIRGVKTGQYGSDQQEAILEHAAIGDPYRIVCCCFNSSIRDELSERMPKQGVDCKNFNQFGMANLFPLKTQFHKWKSRDLLAIIAGCPVEVMDKSVSFPILALAEKIRITLTPVDNQYPALPPEENAYENMRLLADRFNIDLPEDETEVFDMTLKLIEAHTKDTARMDFADQVWLPLRLGVSLKNYDLAVVDEGQDLTRCAQELILRSCQRIILVGDPNQAIYGFAGSDINSMDRLAAALHERGAPVMTFPLTKTRRCSKAVVKYAQRICPSFEAFPDTPDGSIARMTDATWRAKYLNALTPKDFVLCRTNAPLLTTAFGLMAEGRKVQMIGRDFGRDLLRTIDTATDGSDKVQDCLDGLSDMTAQKLEQWLSRPVDDDVKEMWYDRCKVIRMFCQKYPTIDSVRTNITDMFSDDNKDDCIRLSSIHRAKGLEAHRVHYLNEDSKRVGRLRKAGAAMLEDQQEENLRFVAITRAKEDLRLILTPPKVRDEEEYHIPRPRKKRRSL